MNKKTNFAKFADLRKANRSPGKSFAEFGGYTGAALNETEKKLLQDYIKKNGPLGGHPAPGSIIDPEGEGKEFNYESIQKEEDKLIEQEENDAGYAFGGVVDPKDRYSYSYPQPGRGQKEFEDILRNNPRTPLPSHDANGLPNYKTIQQSPINSSISKPKTKVMGGLPAGSPEPGLSVGVDYWNYHRPDGPGKGKNRSFNLPGFEPDRDPLYPRGKSYDSSGTLEPPQTYGTPDLTHTNPPEQTIGRLNKPVRNTAYQDGGVVDEQAFQQWYSNYAGQQGLDPNPDDPRHFYDYRGAFASGAQPDASGHMPSQFKTEGHPRMVIDGVNTKTGQSARSMYKPGSKERAELLKFVLRKKKYAKGGIVRAEDGVVVPPAFDDTMYSPEIREAMRAMRGRTKTTPEGLQEEQSLQQQADLQTQLNPGMAASYKQAYEAENPPEPSFFEQNVQPDMDLQIERQTSSIPPMGKNTGSVAGRTLAHAPGMTTEEAPMATGVIPNRAPATVELPAGASNKVDVAQETPEAPGSTKPIPQMSEEGYLATKKRESGSAKEPYKVVNQGGYAGAWQMGTETLEDLGYVKKGTSATYQKGGVNEGKNINDALNDPSNWTGKDKVNSKDDFLNSPEKQDKIARESFADLSEGLERNGLFSYVGKTFKGVPITSDGLIAAAHGIGMTNLIRSLNSDNDFADGNDFKLSERLADYAPKGSVSTEGTGGGQPSMALSQAAPDQPTSDQSKPEDPMTTMLKQYMAQRQGYKADVADARRRQGLIAALNAIGDASRGIASGSVQAKGGLPMTQPKWDSKVPSLADMGVVKPETADLTMMKAFMPKTMTEGEKGRLSLAREQFEATEKNRKTLADDRDESRKLAEQNLALKEAKVARLEPKEREEYQRKMNQAEAISRIEELFEIATKKGDPTSRLAELKLKAQSYFPGYKQSKDLLALKAASDKELFAYVKAISGAQFSAAEFTAYKEIIPTIGDNPVGFRTKLDGLKHNYGVDKRNFITSLRETGKDVDALSWGNKPIQQTANPETTFQYQGQKYNSGDTFSVGGKLHQVTKDPVTGKLKAFPVK